MRWFVDISAIGSGGKASRFCVEATEWQRALQSVRGLRGDTSPFANFSIELLDDGYRAIDPLTRTRFVVQKAPEGAELTTMPVEIDTGGSIPPPSLAKPADTKGRAADRQRRRGLSDAKPNGTGKPAEPAANAPTPIATATKAPTPIASAPAPKAPTPVAATPQAKAPAPVAASPAPVAASPAPKAGAPAPGALVPPFKVLSEKSQDPTEASPITYREIAFALPEGATDGAAEALVRAQFEKIRASLRGVHAGQYINLAVFDHEFSGKPSRPPIVTLAFKDWQQVDGRGAEPALRFPLRGGPTSGPSSSRQAPAPIPSEPSPAARDIPPPADSITTVGPPPGTEDNPEELEAEPDPTETPTVPIETHAEPRADAAAPASIATPIIDIAAEPVSMPMPVSEAPDKSLGARGVHPVVDVAGLGGEAGAKKAPEAAPGARAPSVPPADPAVARAPSVPPAAPAAARAPSIPPAAPATPAPARESAPPVSAEAPRASSPSASIPRPSAPSLTPQRRSSGENLIIELFEAVSDLALLSDPLEGADFVLRVALENMPSAVAIVSFFSFDSRDFVAVRAAGQSVSPAIAQAIMLKRISERSPIPTRAMRTHQTVVLDEDQAMQALADDPRWTAAEIVPAHYMCAPVSLGGRYLGLIEICNPVDGVAFSAEDGHALTYIGQQLGEFLAQRDLVLDPERITAPKLNARIRRG